MNRLGRAMADPTRSRILLSLLEGPGYPAQLARDLQAVEIGHLELFLQGLAHAGEFQFLQLVEKGLVQHRRLRLSGSRPGHAD